MLPTDYTITFPIAAYSPGPGRLFVPTGLARDLRSQLKFEPHLRIIVPRARRQSDVRDAEELSSGELPGFSFRLLPWNGNQRTFLLFRYPIRKVLEAEAARALVWHTCCGVLRRDLTTESFAAGRNKAVGVRVLGLDSDPAAMLEQSGRAKDADVLRRRYEAWAGEVDLTIMVGKGVQERYASHARRSVLTHSVWLNTNDLADADSVARKFHDLSVVRMVLPSRFSDWKGIDDVIIALRSVSNKLTPWTLDIMGDGDDRARLLELAAAEPRIRFIEPLPYGAAFFAALRTYHLVIAPTRAQEETRIVYDAAASGCALLHSATTTLDAALFQLERRWRFLPGNSGDLARSLGTAFDQRASWQDAGLEGLRFMHGRTIDEMHAIRAAEITPLKQAWLSAQS